MRGCTRHLRIYFPSAAPGQARRRRRSKSVSIFPPRCALRSGARVWIGVTLGRAAARRAFGVSFEGGTRSSMSRPSRDGWEAVGGLEDGGPLALLLPRMTSVHCTERSVSGINSRISNTRRETLPRACAKAEFEPSERYLVQVQVLFRRSESKAVSDRANLGKQNSVMRDCNMGFQ